MGSVLGQACFQVGKNQPLKTLCNNGSKSNWAEVIEGHCTSMFWYRYNGGCFEAVGNNGLGQREVANVGEDLSQLFSTGPKHSARDAIRAGSFMCVHLTQGGTHITGGKCERQVVRCEHSFDGWFCFSTIKASIKVVQFIREGGIAVLNLSSMRSL